jgi:predicted porin
MKKLALAAALTAAFTGSAFAQSSVTLYGRVNTTVEFQDNGAIDKTVVRNNASRWGLRGSEDMGGGLSAFFQLESGFASDTGASAPAGFNREAFVGLKSASLGQIKMGRITSALYFSTLDYIGNFNHDTGATSEDNIYGAYFINGTGTQNNAVEYTSPAFGPVSFAVTVAASEGSAANNKTYEGVVNYDQGSLHIGAGYAEYENSAGAKLGDFFSSAVSYGFGSFNVGLAYEHANSKAASGGFGKRDAVTFTGQYNLGASEFHLSVGYADKWKSVVADTKYIQYTLGYKYNLSKRTAVYAFYMNGDNNNAFGGNLYSGLSDLPARANDDYQIVGLGLRHNF